MCCHLWVLSYKPSYLKTQTPTPTHTHPQPHTHIHTQMRTCTHNLNTIFKRHKNLIWTQSNCGWGHCGPDTNTHTHTRICEAHCKMLSHHIVMFALSEHVVWTIFPGKITQTLHSQNFWHMCSDIYISHWNLHIHLNKGRVYKHLSINRMSDVLYMWWVSWWLKQGKTFLSPGLRSFKVNVRCYN